MQGILPAARFNKSCEILTGCAGEAWSNKSMRGKDGGVVYILATGMEWV
jgi:hypothetical protein